MGVYLNYDDDDGNRDADNEGFDVEGEGGFLLRTGGCSRQASTCQGRDACGEDSTEVEVREKANKERK